MKTCTKCGGEKSIEAFGRHKGGLNGMRSTCKDCDNIYNKEYHQKNAERIRARKKVYQLDHYYKNKTQYYARNAKRRAGIAKATPSWLTEEDFDDIRNFYEEAKYFSYDVDHIIPLKGKLVCGLHVPSNLQIIPHKENVIKNNRYEVV